MLEMPQNSKCFCGNSQEHLVIAIAREHLRYCNRAREIAYKLSNRNQKSKNDIMNTEAIRVGTRVSFLLEL